MGFGVDAHSMLKGVGDVESVRLATADVLEQYVAGQNWQQTHVSTQQALEEEFFVGLRLNQGVSLERLQGRFGAGPMEGYQPIIADLVRDGLLDRHDDSVLLTLRGRLLSNEVFEKFVSEKVA